MERNVKKKSNKVERQWWREADSWDGNDMQRTGESVGERERWRVWRQRKGKIRERGTERADGGRGRWGSPGGHTMCERSAGELLCLSAKRGLWWIKHHVNKGERINSETHTTGEKQGEEHVYMWGKSGVSEGWTERKTERERKQTTERVMREREISFRAAVTCIMFLWEFSARVYSVYVVQTVYCVIYHSLVSDLLEINYSKISLTPIHFSEIWHHHIFF